MGVKPEPNLCFTSFPPEKAGVPRGQLTQNPGLVQGHQTLRLLTELRMFEKVTVTDAMAEDMEKLRPRLKKVHIRELVLAITIMPKTHKLMFTCGRKCCCSLPSSSPRDVTVAARPLLGWHHIPGGPKTF